MPTVLAIATLISVLIAFFLALKSGSKQYSSKYMDVILNSWGKIILTLLPIILYTVIAIHNGGWDTLINSAEFALAAALVSGLGIQEMCCVVAIKHNRDLNKNRVSFLSILALVVFTTSLTSMVYVYVTSQGGILIFFFQIFLFLTSVFSYFGTGAVISMIEQNVSQTRKF
jgi:hypothetical protein